MSTSLYVTSDDKLYIYQDYSLVSSEGNDNDNLVHSNPSPAFIRVQKLTVKLNAILSNPDLSNIITWMPHGRSWKILQPNEFVSAIMPLYFETTNYNSFLRLANAWGFRRITSGPDKNSYFHELFLRGIPHLHRRMRRFTSHMKKLPMLTENEPKFSVISNLRPLPEATVVKLNVDTTNSDHIPIDHITETHMSISEQETNRIGTRNHDLSVMALNSYSNLEYTRAQFEGGVANQYDVRLVPFSRPNIGYVTVPPAFYLYY